MRSSNEKQRDGGGQMSSIGGLGRDCTLPGWSVRPGAVPALRPAGEALFLWHIIASINGSGCTACFASEDELARLLCRSRGTLRRRLESLRAVPGLLFEVKRPPVTRDRLPTVFRWATDPFAVGYWYHCITRHRIPGLAEDFGILGLDSRWLLEATRHASHHATASKNLACEILPKLLESTTSVVVQDGEGVVKGSAGKQLKPSGYRQKPKRPRAKQNRARGSKKKDAGGALSPGWSSVREGAAVALPRSNVLQEGAA